MYLSDRKVVESVYERLPLEPTVDQASRKYKGEKKPRIPSRLVA
jgi:hypothetical protein